MSRKTILKLTDVQFEIDRYIEELLQAADDSEGEEQKDYMQQVDEMIRFGRIFTAHIKAVEEDFGTSLNAQ